MTESKIFNFTDAAIAIKNAIVRSRYQAAVLVNKELLCLYYAVGQYVSENSRGIWGKGAVKQVSDILQKELPGLHGFSESSIKRMRTFYEEWQSVFTIRPLSTGELQNTALTNNSSLMNDLRFAENIPQNLQKALPDIDDMRKLLETVAEEQSLEVKE